MRPKDPLEPEDQPQTRRDLEFWVRDHLDLRPEKVTALTRIADVFGMIGSSTAAKLTIITIFIVGSG